MQKHTIHNDLDISFARKVFMSIIEKLSPISLKIAARRSLDIRFLTEECPSLRKAVDTALSTENLDLNQIRFKKKKGTKLPLFLYEHFEAVFTLQGELREEISYNSLRIIRSILDMFYKLEQPFSDEQKQTADKVFLATDFEVKSDYTQEQIDRISSTIRFLMPDDVDVESPRYGSGAVFPKVANNHSKVHTHRFNSTLEEVFPISLDFQNREHANQVALEIEQPVANIVHIPKDSRGPRTIAIQPHRMMKYQLPLMDILYSYIESKSTHAYKRVNFTDQTINQRLAQEGSVDKKYSTIDLKSASDLVSWDLVKRCVSPEWLARLTATRATHCLIDGELHALKKFASMGSALCFPIEAIVFYAIARTVTPNVWVYGDDIIVPGKDYFAVIDALVEYGLQVNVDKSLHHGFFRESCGGDYYKGHLINPIRLKSLTPLSIIAFANNIGDVFGFETADGIIAALEEELGEFFPRSDEHAPERPFVYRNGRTKRNSVVFKRRWNHNLHIHESFIPSLKRIDDKIDHSADIDENSYYEWLRVSKARDHRPNDWFGVQSAHGFETRAGYKWVPSFEGFFG